MMTGEWNGQEVPRILIIDDESASLAALEEIITEAGYLPVCAWNAAEAMETIRRKTPQLILSDVSMPGMTGLELCRLLKDSPRTRDIPVIFISVLDDRDDMERAFLAGAVDFIVKPCDKMELIMRVNTHLKIYRMSQEMEKYNHRLHRMVTEQAKKIEAEQRNILLALAKLTEGRDNAMGNHLENVSHNSRVLAQSLQFSPVFEKDISESFIETIEVASRLHDIGKIVVPDEVLLSPGPLTESQRAVMQRHSESGAAILEEIAGEKERSRFMEMAIAIARYHHAKFDGTGYPSDIKGRKIPLAARIFILVDVYDALTGVRCYKDSYTEDDSVEVIKAGSGVFFDPDIVEVFLKVKKQFCAG